MIAFDLRCCNNHVFEGWFKDGASFEEQKEKGLVTCPICDDKSISKIPSAFSISKANQYDNNAANKLDIKEISKRIYDFIEKNFDDVGCNFTKEALKIHYGVSEPRHIKGFSTAEEEKILKDEGIQFFKIPVPQNTESKS